MKLFAGALLLIAAVVVGVRSGASRISCPADFEVRVVGAAADAPPVAGACVVENGRPAFRPAFPLMPGVSYSVHAGGREIERIGARVSPAAPSTSARVYPTATVLPANQLKVYVEFSSPMMLGEAHRRMRLLDASGEEVSGAFLAVDEEMWDADRKRLTVLFDPGRVKRGLKANFQSGAPLLAGASYSLVIDRDWPDANGVPLKTATVREFAVTSADRARPDPRSWKLSTPAAGTRAALQLSFNEPMDYAVALNAIRVVDDRGQRVDGTVVLADSETVWQFRPADPWPREPHTLVIDSRIEDLAGNNLQRAFDADLRGAPAATADALRWRFTPCDYSSRSTTMGSTRVARLAGM